MTPAWPCALCLVASLVEHGFDAHDQMDRYLQWHDEGYMSSTDKCFDIGVATSQALERYRRNGNPVAGSSKPDNAGNGSLMRLAPVPIYYLETPELAVQMSAAQSKLTHQAPECLVACRLLAQALNRALQGKAKDAALASFQHALPMSNALKELAEGQYKTKAATQIKGSGYVVESLEAAFWCFWQTDSFQDCVLLAANLGDDADTTAPVAGQLAGAFHGESGIPAPWLQKLTMRIEIGLLAEQLTLQKPKR